MTKMEKAARVERMARAMIATQPLERLLEQWEILDRESGDEVPMVRGWYLDELEKRDGEAFEAWLDGKNGSDNPKDYFLRAA